ncbi:MAG: hypothetical protein Q7T11_01130 [Deltaproteobacteria bacterium]|nr:hypothetical protein [Deltaproteobacteria bacterium]
MAVSTPATLFYEENEPLRRVFAVTIFPDLTVLVSEKKIKPFCATPASNDCWEETKRSQKISRDQYDRLINFISSRGFENLPAEAPKAPGTSSVHLSFPLPSGGKTGSIRLEADALFQYPDFREFQQMMKTL